LSDKARILIFTGQGKGKTTAALGMALRASGHEMRVLIIQFIKKCRSGESKAVEKFSNITMVQTGMGFFHDKSNAELIAHKNAAEKGLHLAQQAIVSSEYQMIILDEICYAVSKGLLEEQKVIAVLEQANPVDCLVLTGRGATEGLLDLADTVTKMQYVKHAMDSGTPAQRGVEL
jgi:cob(I)alamin adenosyltransferase